MYFIEPEDVNVTNKSTMSLTVSWKPAQSRYCGNVLYYVCLLTNYTVLAPITINATDQNCTFDGLSANTVYNISVSAVNKAGIGEAAIVVNITTDSSKLFIDIS